MYCFKLNKLKPDRFTNGILWALDKIVNKDVWLAGGSLRTFVDQNETIVDYDLFFSDFGYRERSMLRVNLVRNKLEDLGFKLTFECPEGKMYTYEKENEYKEWCQGDKPYIKHKVQLICEYFYGSPEELLATFDLTPCIFATDGEFLWAYKSAIKGVRTKQVRLNKLTYPIATMKRLIKYGKKGYNTNLACKDFVLMLGNLMGVDTILLSEDQLRQYID